MPTTTTVDGVAIHHQTVGQGRDLVLIHGISDSSATWGPVTELFAEHYRVTTLDLRGMGESGDAADYGSVGMARDVAAVVAAAAVTVPLVVGHSLGAVVATAYASQAPVRGVVNVDQPLRLSDFQASLLQIEPLLRDPDSFAVVLRAMFDGMDGALLTDDVKEHIVGCRRQRQEVVLGVWDEVLFTSVADLDAMIASLTSTITAAYLAVHFIDLGPDYPVWLTGLIQHAVVETWSTDAAMSPIGYGHYGHRVDPQRFVERVIAFDQ